MTANELADKLRQEGLPYVEQAATMLRQQQDKLTKYELRHAEQRKRIDELETMLRQQQAEIEALKGEVAQLKHMNKNWSISEGWALQEIERLKVQYGICEDKP